MNPRNVVVAQKRSKRNAALITALNSRFQNVSMAGSIEELRQQLAKSKPLVCILDLELLDASEFTELQQNYPQTRFICTHSIATTSFLPYGAAGLMARNEVRAITDCAAKQKSRVTAA